MSEKQRFGFPILGNYDTWKWDKPQNLNMENHGTVLLSNWLNTSDYKATDDSFDTVALHCDELQQAPKKYCEELGPIKQT